MCRDCGEMNVCSYGGLVANGEPHWGRMAFSKLMLQISWCGQAYPGLLEGLDTCSVRSTRGMTSGTVKAVRPELVEWPWHQPEQLLPLLMAYFIP